MPSVPFLFKKKSMDTVQALHWHDISGNDWSQLKPRHLIWVIKKHINFHLRMQVRPQSWWLAKTFLLVVRMCMMSTARNALRLRGWIPYKVPAAFLGFGLTRGSTFSFTRASMWNRWEINTEKVRIKFNFNRLNVWWWIRWTVSLEYVGSIYSTASLKESDSKQIKEKQSKYWKVKNFCTFN